MPKNPDNMTPDERLKRIRSLERKCSDLEWRLEWAEREQMSTQRWAEESWAEVRRLHGVCTQHWTEKQEIRRAAGLEPVPSYIPLAKWNPDTREWEPEDLPPLREGDRPLDIEAPATSGSTYAREASS